MSFEAHVQIGFVGQVEFVALNNLSAHNLVTFNCLSDYAFYCGTGHKTTQGMGQTRRM